MGRGRRWRGKGFGDFQLTTILGVLSWQNEISGDLALEKKDEKRKRNVYKYIIPPWYFHWTLVWKQNACVGRLRSFGLEIVFCLLRYKGEIPTNHDVDETHKYPSLTTEVRGSAEKRAWADAVILHLFSKLLAYKRSFFELWANGAL